MSTVVGNVNLASLTSMPNSLFVLTDSKHANIQFQHDDRPGTSQDAVVYHTFCGTTMQERHRLVVYFPSLQFSLEQARRRWESAEPLKIVFSRLTWRLTPNRHFWRPLKMNFKIFRSLVYAVRSVFGRRYKAPLPRYKGILPNVPPYVE